MSAPITPPLAVNPIITILPVTSQLPGRDPAGVQNLIALLADGSVLRGYVVNRDAQNNPIIRTEKGDFVVQSDVFIKTGSEISIALDPAQTAQGGKARIVSIDKQTPEAYAAQNARGLTEDTIEPVTFKATNIGTTAAAQQPTQTPGTTQPLPLLTAVVLQAMRTNQPQLTTPGQPAQPMPPALQQLPSGTPLTLTVYDVKLPPVPVPLASIAVPPAVQQLQPPLPGTPPVTSQPTPVPAQAAPLTTPAASSTQNTTTAPARPSTAIPMPTNPAPAAIPLSNPLLAAQTNARATTPFIPAAPAAIYQPAVANAGTQQTQAPQINAAPPPPSPQIIAQPAFLAAGTTAPITMPRTQPTTPAMPANAAITTPSYTFQGTVIGQGEDGSAIVHTPFASVKLYLSQPLPTGTNLALSAEIGTPPAGTTLPAFPPTAQTTLPLPDLKYLGPLFAQVMAADPALARAVLQQFPAIGPRFTSGLLFFLTAVKGGERRALSALDNARVENLAPGLLSQLSKDMREFSQLFNQSPLDDWKPIPLPLIFGSGMERAQLYIRKEPDESTAAVEKTNSGHRFLLDVHLSELGDMQLDGFVRGGERAKSLELFLRTALPLEGEMGQEIRALFTNALETSGMPGNLVLQQGSEHFVKPQPKPPASGANPEPHTILA